MQAAAALSQTCPRWKAWTRQGGQTQAGTQRRRAKKNCCGMRPVGRGYPHGPSAELLLAIGQRRGEMANLVGALDQREGGTITLPEWATKNSKKEHTFPYGDLVAEILVPFLASTTPTCSSLLGYPTSGRFQGGASTRRKCRMAFRIGRSMISGGPTGAFTGKSGLRRKLRSGL